MDSVINVQDNQIENLTASRSTIIDADLAEEAANYAKAKILQQTTSTLLAQSKNLHSSIITSLLNGI